MKKILILGTGNAQEDIIRYCKNDNFEIHACSYTSGDNAEKYVDYFSLINITDTEAICKYVYQNQIDFIYSVGSDIAMPSVSYVAERCGLPYFVSYETAHICNNKHLLRQYLGKQFTGNLSYMVLTDILNKIDVPFPAVMKPVDSQGQRGVIKVTDKRELDKNFSHSLSFSKSKKVILEEYVEGDEVSVNAFVLDREIKFALISDREVWKDYPGGIIRRHVLPSKYSGSKAEIAIKDLVERVICKLDIQNGPVYFQIKMKNNMEPKLLEVTPRLDGCHMWRLIREYTGVDLLACSVKLLESKPVELEYEKPLLKNATLEFMCAPPGTEFDSSQYSTNEARFIKYYYEDGQTVKAMNGYMEKCGYIIRGQ
jgi:carbamoylphosphate synthase large subunit